MNYLGTDPNEKTKAPLTVSIEGAWGSGKSSFMLQLQKELEIQRPSSREQHYINFNAWRNDKDEVLWAAFALTLINQVSKKVPIWLRAIANIKLLWKRLDWQQGWFQLAQFATSLLVICGLTLYAILKPDVIFDFDVATIAVVGPWLAAAYFGYEKTKKVLGNPLSYDLSKYVRNLKYDEKISFIERFQNDLADILKSYLGPQGRVFIFIDDLDRYEIPRAADLLQAINLLLSTDQANLYFILGLDRETVAAGIAAKNEKILPYLAAARSSVVNESDLYRIGIDYGFSFMEKFIQVPFRVPHPDEREITSWVADLTAAEDKPHPPPSTSNPSQWGPFDIHAGLDPQCFEPVVQTMARKFGFNPRRLKQYINIFRLRVSVALSTGVLIPAPDSAGSPGQPSGITIHQLGLFTAILMRWPRLFSDLVEMPILLTELAAGRKLPDEIGKKWGGNVELRDAIKLDNKYSLILVDLRPLLMIMPNVYPGSLGETDLSGSRTQLVASLTQPASGNTSPTPDHASPSPLTAQTAPTDTGSTISSSSGAFD